MIVKDEAHVIGRCLESVKGLIDYWVIVDTGSTDGTQEKIKEILKDIPGDLYERPWRDFAKNRNEAKRLAKDCGTYLMLMDADDKIVLDKDFKLPEELTADLYSVPQREMHFNTFREHQVFFLIKNDDDDLIYKGNIHEYLSCPNEKTKELLKGIKNMYGSDGARNQDENKITKDIELLQKAILEDESDSRSVFYLARTYWSIRDFSQALIYFSKRSVMGGDPIEVYHSILYLGLCQKSLNFSSDIWMNTLSLAHVYRPTRHEAIYEIIRHLANGGNFLLGYLIAKYAASIKPSNDNLFVESWVSEWGINLYLFICSVNIGNAGEAIEVCQSIIDKVPESVKTEFKLQEYLDNVSKSSELDQSIDSR